MTDTWLIVGLGNPGSPVPREQAQRRPDGAGRTRRPDGRGFKSHKARAQVVEGRLGIGGPRVVLAKPHDAT